MAMVHINKNPSRRDLLVFTLAMPVCFGILGALRWRAGSIEAAEVVWGAGLLVSVVALLYAPARLWIYLGWMYATYPIAWTVSQVALLAIYFLIATPTALVLRAVGHDRMQRGFDKKPTSYCFARRPTTDTARYFRQF